MVSALVVSIIGLNATCDPSNPLKYEANHAFLLTGEVHPDITLYPYEVCQLAVTRKIDAKSVMGSLFGMLVNTAYESVRDRNDHSPEFEFFRHIRNAGSHRNSLYFFPNEPIRPAEWRRRQIDHTSRGDANPLQGRLCFGDYLGPADAIALLWDIEQHLARQGSTP